jgi:hypothetical protein
MVVIDGGFIVELILMLVFLAIGFYCLTRSSLTAPNGVIYLVVAIIFIILGVLIGLALAGVGIT